MALPTAWRGRRFPLPAACLPLLILSLAHIARSADRITLAVDDSRRATLPGHVSPRIASAADQGVVDPSMELHYVLLVLAASPSQQADLNRLLAQQQDPSSPYYHIWLTPEQYADRFGVSQPDLDKIVAWLGRHNLTVKSVARGRNTVAFGGAAGAVATAFGVEIHRYLADGELHYANTADPTVPAAFQGVVQVVQGLNDFRLKPMLLRSAQPRFDLSGSHFLAPDDIATIYDIAPLYNAGFTGTGQTLAVMGQTDIELTDIAQYRSYFNLPANSPTLLLVPGSPNPGLSSGDLAEADLDLELSGAVARNATVLFVYSNDAVFSFEYAIDQNIAPVIGMSYGNCEVQLPLSEVEAFDSWGSQASAQGQTIFAASGDNGAADCFVSTDRSTTDGNTTESVDMPASLPQVTGVGGTTFNDSGTGYWSSTNTANHASALSYIPETAWNDSSLTGTPTASGGGASSIYPKPSWQTGPGVPADGHRDVPDVSLAASPNHDGYYIISGGKAQIIGGTSVGPPQFSGIVALLNQYLVSKGFQQAAGLGNINPALYQNLWPVADVFHDIVTGNNIVTPCAGQCTLSPFGYDAGVGYDRVTGIGTPDVYNLVTAWDGSGVTAKSTASMAVAASPNRVAFTDTTTLTATVTSSGGATPTGTVTFSLPTESLGTATLDSSAVATLTLSAVQLAVGANTVTAQYNGDNAHYGASSSVSIVETTPANGLPLVGGLANAASFTDSLAPGGILSIFGTQLAPATGSAPGLPLPTMMAGTTVTIGDYLAPLYYVSPTQLNVQIPYEVSPGSSITLRVTNNGLNVFSSLNLGATAPAIFTTNAQGTGQGAILNTSYQLVDASHPATPGSTYLQIYCMGLGAVSNQPEDGAPASSTTLSQTSSTPTVTIGNLPANVTFSGLAPGFVGLYQVNALVPATVPAGGAVPVVVSLGGVASNTATIAVGP
jgi:uncharacterized protein (TIGR03437 family)